MSWPAGRVACRVAPIGLRVLVLLYFRSLRPHVYAWRGACQRSSAVRACIATPVTTRCYGRVCSGRPESNVPPLGQWHGGGPVVVRASRQLVR